MSPWRLSLLGVLAAVLAAAGGGASFGGAPEDPPLGRMGPREEPSLKDPLPFRHARHKKAFAKADVGCTTCHPVGLATPVEGQTRRAPDLPPPPRSSCHACHVEAAVPGAPRAPRPCEACHADRRELLPVSHGVGWHREHAFEARDPQATCRDCHHDDTCVSCHESRGAGARSPHGPGFGSTHGIEARVDPASCSRCHDGVSCQECHSSGALPW